jgi:WD40 repeat protein
MRNHWLILVLIVTALTFTLGQTRPKPHRTTDGLIGTSWKAYIKENGNWKEWEMSPFTILEGGKVVTSDSNKPLLWKQIGSQVEIKDTEIGWPHVWATIKGSQMEGIVQPHMTGSIEYFWRAVKIQSPAPILVTPNVTMILPQVVPFRSLTLNGDTDPTSIAFSPDGQILAVCAYNNSLQIWSVREGHLLNLLPSKTGDKLVFSPDGQYLALGENGGTVLVWRTKDWALLHTLPSGYIDKLRFSSDRTSLETGDYQNVKYWRLSDGRLYRTEKRTEEYYDMGITNPWGIWKYESLGKQIQAVLDRHRNYGRDNSHFIKLQKILDKKLMYRLTLLPAGNYRLQSTNIVFSPDSRLLLAISDGQLLDAYTGNVQDESRGLPGVIKLWQVSAGRLLFNFRASRSDENPTSVAFSPDGKTFAVGQQRKIKVWQIRGD